MLKRILSHRLTGAVAFMILFGGLLFVTLRDGKAVEKTKKGWLGVSVQELTPSLREAMKVGNRPGLLITHVVDRSPADDANLRDEDVILEFDGKTVEKADEFVRLVRNTPPDKKIKIKFLREGETREVEVVIGQRKSERRQSYSYGWGDGRHLMIFGGPRLGVQVQELNEDLAPYFKVEPKSGVLILEVREDSPAEKAGLKAGDVITKVDKETVADPQELIEAMKDYEEGEAVTIEYVRQGKTATVKVELEYADGHGFEFWGPGRHEIRIQRFDRDRWRDAERMMPELRRHLEAMQEKIKTDVGRLKLRLHRSPSKLEIEASPVI